jgi:phosphoribosylanthranilate isomerase
VNATALDTFLSPSAASLKICGVTTPQDAAELVALKVPALGINFFPKSKRYCPPEKAAEFLPNLKDQILRVGVFVNNVNGYGPLFHFEELIDVFQFHGTEDSIDLRHYLSIGVPCIRSLSLPEESEVAATLHHYRKIHSEAKAPFALLLDAHAPGIYGGTGQTIDWDRAAAFIAKAAPLPVILAGGITPDNATRAIAQTHPSAIDIASGAESTPGIKDFAKVKKLLVATHS